VIIPPDGLRAPDADERVRARGFGALVTGRAVLLQMGLLASKRL
jgi:hypothetical protein